MKKLHILLIICMSINLIALSQSKFGSKLKEEKKNNNDVIGYSISGTIEGLEDTSVILAYYFGGKQYAADTAQSINGNFSFKGTRELEGGMYLVVLPNQQFFDIIISEKKFSFNTKLDDLVGSMNFKNSKENTPFYNYLRFITEMQKEVTPIRNEMESATEERKLVLKNMSEKIDNKVKDYRRQFMIENSDVFFSKIVQATSEIIIPASPLDSLGNIDKTFPYRFYKQHFWDNIDFSDQRMLRTPLFFNKMDQYFEKLTAKHPDSINISADILVNLSKANGEIFQYVVSYITSTYERSKIMGMDAVFVHMVENYYITKQCDWVDSLQLIKIVDRAEKIAPNLIGRKASEFLDFYGRPFMKDPSGKTHTLNEIIADYTLLVFFGPTCGHCKKEMPKVKHKLDSLIAEGIDIKTFIVATEFDKVEWQKFIDTQKTGEWLNVADINHDEEGNPVASSDWRDKYDIYSTPVIYLLDRDKKIIAKRITHEQIGEIIGRIDAIN